MSENTDLQRVVDVVDWLIFSKKVASRRDLAEKMGYTESSMSQILNGKVSLSGRFMKKLSIFDDEVNHDWVLTGEGDMFKNPEMGPRIPPVNNYVLLLPLSAQGGSLGEFTQSVRAEDCERIKSPIDGVDFAIAVSGDSMAPEYPNGSRVLIKRIDDRAFIEWGRVYVLDTPNGSVIKVVTPSKREGFVTCSSLNEDPRYAPFDVNMKDVYGVYRVMLCMSLK